MDSCHVPLNQLKPLTTWWTGVMNATTEQSFLYGNFNGGYACYVLHCSSRQQTRQNYSAMKHYMATLSITVKEKLAITIHSM